MTPHGAQPLDTGLEAPVLGDGLEVVEDVSPAHLPQPKKQLAGIVEHDARVAPRVGQFSYEIRDAAVTHGEHRGIVHAVNMLALHHVLEVSHDGRRPQIPVLEDERLVHVKGESEGRLELLDLEFGA